MATKGVLMNCLTIHPTIYLSIHPSIHPSTGADHLTPINDLLSELGWSNVKKRRNQQKALMMFKIMNGMTPAYLEDTFSNNIGKSVYNLRTSRWNLALPAVKTI